MQTTTVTALQLFYVISCCCGCCCFICTRNVVVMLCLLCTRWLIDFDASNNRAEMSQFPFDLNMFSCNEMFQSDSIACTMQQSIYKHVMLQMCFFSIIFTSQMVKLWVLVVYNVFFTFKNVYSWMFNALSHAFRMAKQHFHKIDDISKL